MSDNTTNQKQVHEVHYRYVPVEETLKNEETEYTSYGISVRNGDEEIAFVSDISTNLSDVSKLAQLCTEHELAPEQLGDVIEDFLIEGSLSLT